MIILSDKQIKSMIDVGEILVSSTYHDLQLQPASLDLTLGEDVWLIDHSIPPSNFKKTLEYIQKTISKTSLKEALITKNKVVIAELQESLNLPEDISGKCSPKSSIGRTDMLVRIITENGTRFDYIPKNYKGKLYAEIITQSFDILIPPYCAVSQIRFIDHSKTSKRLNPLPVDVNLEGEIIGYMASTDPYFKKVVDLGRLNPIEMFWTPITKKHLHDDYLLLRKDKFYILSSCAEIQMPPTHCGELVDFDSSSGELRLHYAGFIDPGFGYDKGASLVYEVRPFIDTLIFHKQTVGDLIFHEMLRIPDRYYGSSDLTSHYQGQRGPILSKYFNTAEEGTP